MAQTFFQKVGFTPFLEYVSWREAAESTPYSVYEKYEAALEACKDEVTPRVDPIVRYDKRVKEIESLKDKIFNRILEAQRNGKHVVWNYFMNDGIGVRIVFDIILAPGKSAQFAKCMEVKLHTSGLRSRDDLTWYMSGNYDVPSLNVHNVNPEHSVLECQMWPLATGTWMRWQHERYYKAPQAVKKERRVYVKSLQMAAMCMDDTEFVTKILPGITTKAALENWLNRKCNRFLIYKRRIAQKKKTEKLFKPKDYEPKSDIFNLNRPIVDPPIEPIDLIGIIWHYVEKAREI